jgi:hypothetical protein
MIAGSSTGKTTAVCEPHTRASSPDSDPPRVPPFHGAARGFSAQPCRNHDNPRCRVERAALPGQSSIGDDSGLHAHCRLPQRLRRVASRARCVSTTLDTDAREAQPVAQQQQQERIGERPYKSRFSMEGSPMRRLSLSHSSLPVPHVPHDAWLLLPFVTLGTHPLHGVVSVPRIRLSAMRI